MIYFLPPLPYFLSKISGNQSIYCSSTFSSFNNGGYLWKHLYSRLNYTLFPSGSQQHQNMVIDLDPVKYDSFMLPMIECLKYSPFRIALSKMENVLLSILSKAYFSKKYVNEEQRIMFEIHNRTTSITKFRLCSLL